MEHGAEDFLVRQWFGTRFHRLKRDTTLGFDTLGQRHDSATVFNRRLGSRYGVDHFD
jgi:hypothetical protein